MNRYGDISVMLPCCSFSVIVLVFFRFVHELQGLVVISIVYGFLSGGMVALPEGTIANLTNDLSEYSTRMGMVYTVASLGVLIRNPIGGAAYRRGVDDARVDFQGSWLFAGSLLLAAAAMMAVARYFKFGMTMTGRC